MRAASVLLSVGLVARLLMPAYARAQPAREDPNGSPSAVFHAQCALCHGEGGRADTRIGRALKVAPLVNDARLAAMTAEQIATLVKGDPKHRGVVTLRDADIARAAYFVKQLAREGP